VLRLCSTDVPQVRRAPACQAQA